MADQKISALQELTNLATIDEVAVVDKSGSDTRRITAKNLIQQGVALIDSGSIPGIALGALPANLVTTTSIQSAAVTAVKLAANSVGSSALQSNSVGLSELAASSVDASILASNIDINSKIAALNITGSSIADNTLTNAKYSNSSISYAKLNLSDGDIPGAKINSCSITSTQLGSASVTAAKIASNSIVASALQSNIITNSHIAANTIEANSIAPNAIGSSELADASVDTNALQDASVTGSKIADASITPAKLSGSISTDFLADGAITAAKLGASSVTASALANSSVGTSALINSSVTDAKISAVNGSKIVAGSLPVSAIDTSDIGTGLSVTAGSLVIANSVTAGTATKISFSSQGLVTGGSSLLSSDLPVADVSNVGGVYIPANSGLSVTGTGALTLASSITATTVSGVSVNNRGIVTSIVALTSSDIPTSSSSVKGGVIAQAGGGLSVDSSGNLSTALSGVAAGTYQSVTVTSKGVVTAGQSLSASDIPDISAAKLTTGTIDSGRIAASSIDGTKLSNTSTAIFQSIAQSGYPTAQFNGQLLFDTVSEDAFIYDGNAWQAITTLTKGSLVFGGTYNASTSKMVSTTTAGIAAGLAVGSNLPTPSATTDGLYVVVDTAGTAQAPAPVVSFSPPDYILGVTNSSGSSWNEIDLSQTVAGQVASNITFTPYGQLSSTNVQDAIQAVSYTHLTLPTKRIV